MKEVVDMESTPEQLKARGFADQLDIMEMDDLSTQKLFDGVNSPIPENRTASIMILSATHLEDSHFIDVILKRLAVEKKLYTKIAICNALEKAGAMAARKMAEYLGKIGNNQHKTVPLRVSMKTAYPLPRDIIARSMARMYPAAIEVLFDILNNWERVSGLEAIDAFGFMAFYHSELRTEDNLSLVCDIIDKNASDDLVIWKSVICLSSFPMPRSDMLLNRMAKSYSHPVIRAEAVRSLSLPNR